MINTSVSLIYHVEDQSVSFQKVEIDLEEHSARHIPFDEESIIETAMMCLVVAFKGDMVDEINSFIEMISSKLNKETLH